MSSRNAPPVTILNTAVAVKYSVSIALVSHIGEGYGVKILVCHTTVFSVVTQLSSRHNTKHGCGCVADSTDIALRNETKTAALAKSTQQLRRFPFVRTGRPDKSVSK